MKEPGIDVAGRGIGSFFYALIPWALGIGFTVWFGIWITGHNFQHQLSEEELASLQEKRAAVYVGSPEPQKAQLQIKIIPRDCTHVTRVDAAGKSLKIYARNDCSRTLNYMEYHWQQVSPNNVVVQSGYENTASCSIPTEGGDEAECAISSYVYKLDDRAAIVRVWTEMR